LNASWGVSFYSIFENDNERLIFRGENATIELLQYLKNKKE
jgi:hypothetical protein